MNLNEYVKKLQRLQKQGYGECRLVQSSDDEGNSYQYASPKPQLMFVGKDQNYYIDDYYWEDEFDEEDSEYYVKAIIIN